jgi:hypothetical protein
MATLTRDLTGRRMLENMANFQLAILRQQNETATSSLLGMAGVWPEVDRRDLGDNSYFLNGYLQRRGKAGDDTFLDQVDVVADSATGFSDDIRVRLWKPDLLRRVAIQTGDVDMLDLAIGGYEAVRAGSRYSELVEGKLRKATAQRNRLAKIS